MPNKKTNLEHLKARDLFAKFKKCVAVYEKLYSEGRSISKLTVAA